MPIQTHHQIEEEVKNWALGHDNVFAVLIVGSRAADPTGPDRYADLDFIIFTNQPEELAQTSEWIATIFTPWIAVFNQTGAGDPEWMAISSTGIKTDFVIVRGVTGADFPTWLRQSPYQFVLDRGFRVLVDKTQNALSGYQTGTRVYPKEPPADFSKNFDACFLYAYKMFVCTVRGDLWRGQEQLAKFRRQLIPIIEYYATLENNAAIDTWYDGRHILQWAGEDLVDRFPSLYPRLNAQEMTKSIVGALALLELLGQGIANHIGFDFPEPGQSDLMDWLRAELALSINQSP